MNTIRNRNSNNIIFITGCFRRNTKNIVLPAMRNSDVMFQATLFCTNINYAVKSNTRFCGKNC
jgi:hypothetical protein